MELPEGLMCVECPEPVEGLVWVYILLMRNGMLYVGQTYDVARRVGRHADGSGSRQPKQLKEFILVFVDRPLWIQSSRFRQKETPAPITPNGVRKKLPGFTPTTKL